MKICCISDTHEQADQLVLPEADVLIHAGDWTYRGTSEKINQFWEWFDAQPHTHKIAIAGNHELGLDGLGREYNLAQIASYTNRNPNLHYLENSSVVIDGVKFYGSPITPRFHDWAFNRNPGHDILMDWANIEYDTNVLITHGPPYGILDLVADRSENVGCPSLRRAIQGSLSELKLHVFGHIHPAYGTVTEDGIQYVNASSCNRFYKPINAPIVVEI
jgi:predicted phosphodiesterase